MKKPGRPGGLKQKSELKPDMTCPCANGQVVCFYPVHRVAILFEKVHNMFRGSNATRRDEIVPYQMNPRKLGNEMEEP